MAKAVVIAALRAPDFVAAEQHGRSARNEERGDEVFGVLNASTNNRDIIGFAFAAEIHADIVVGTVAVIFAVFEVMLLGIRAEVAQRETVVRRDEIDALRGVGFFVKDVSTAGDAVRERHDGIIGSRPKAPDIVAEFSVPFCPGGGKIADLIEAGGVPCFGDELCSAEDRVLCDVGEQSEIWIVNPFAFMGASENGRQVEAESVDVHFDDPIAEALDDEVFHDGVVAIHRIAAARIIGIFSARFEHVIDGVIESAKSDGRSAFVSFAAVVEDDVENDFDLRFVKGLYHRTEFFNGGAGRGADRVSLVRAKEADRGVSPVVCVKFSGIGIAQRRRFLGIIGGDGEQFDGSDAHFLEMRNFVDKSEIGAGVRGVCRRVHCHAFDVALVDDAFRESISRSVVDVPAEGSSFDGDGFGACVRAWGLRK